MKLPILQITKYSCLIYIVFSFNLSFGQSLKDSLLLKLNTTQQDTLKIKTIIDKGDNIYYTYPDSAYIYYKQALHISKQIKSIKYEANSLINIGYYLDEKGKYKESLEYYLKALELYKLINDKSGIALCYTYIGYSFAYLNSAEKSYKYFTKALNIYKELDDILGEAYIYNSFGDLYYEKEYYTQAQDYYLKTLAIYELKKDKEGLLSVYVDVGNAISDQGDLDGGLKYYFKSIDLAKELNDLDGLAVNYANIGDCYSYKGDYDQAMLYFNKSIDICKEINYNKLYPYVYSNIALVKLKLKKYDEVIENANISLEYSKKASWVDIEYDAHSYLSSAYAALGDYKKAYKNELLYKQFKDSIFTKKNVEQLSKLDGLYKVEEQENKINELLKSDEIRNIKLKQQIKINYALVFLALAFLVFIILLNYQRKAKHKVNQLLETEKDNAQESDRLKSAFLANMSHEIRTPMNAILGFSSLLKDDDLKSEKRNHFIEVINKSGKGLMTIINDIIDISRIESNQLKVDLKNVDVSNILKDIIEVQKETNDLLTKNKIDLKLKLPTTSHTIFIKTDENRFTQIFNNLINNASKFTKKGSIEIGFELKQNKENSHIQFYVKDTGSGIPETMFEEIFNRFSQVGEKDFKSGNGLGLSICKGILTKLGGDIWLESTEGVGTTFYFTLPY